MDEKEKSRFQNYINSTIHGKLVGFTWNESFKYVIFSYVKGSLGENERLSWRTTDLEYYDLIPKGYKVGKIVASVETMRYENPVSLIQQNTLTFKIEINFVEL